MANCGLKSDSDKFVLNGSLCTRNSDDNLKLCSEMPDKSFKQIIKLSLI